MDDRPFEPERWHLGEIADVADYAVVAEAWEALQARGVVPLAPDPDRTFVAWSPCDSCYGTGNLVHADAWEPVYSRRCKACKAGVSRRPLPPCPAPASALDCVSLASVSHLWSTAEAIAREAAKRLWASVGHFCEGDSEVELADLRRVVWVVVDPTNWAPALHFERAGRANRVGTPYGITFHSTDEVIDSTPTWFTVMCRANMLTNAPRNVRLMWPDDIMEQARDSRDPAIVRALHGLPPRHLRSPAEAYFYTAREASGLPHLSLFVDGGARQAQLDGGNPFDPIHRLNLLGFALHGVSRRGIEVACPRALPDHPGWPRSAPQATGASARRTSRRTRAAAP